MTAHHPDVHLPLNRRRREIYDSILDHTHREGIDLDRFFSNPSYFGKDQLGNVIEWAGHHQALLHWPLVEYRGGPALIESFKVRTHEVAEIAGSDSIRWVEPEHWHSTVFSPVHSSDPKVIGYPIRDISKEVSAVLNGAASYMLRFTRVAVTNEGGILAVAFTNTDEVDRIREGLSISVPSGHASPLVHVTLGHFIQPLGRTAVNALNEFTRAFKGDSIVLGQVEVRFLTLALYYAPFLQMKVEELSRWNLKDTKDV
jgi:hypothetical protein